MSATHGTTLWCDNCSRHLQIETPYVRHARHLARAEGWTRLGRGDKCPWCIVRKSEGLESES